MSQTSRGQLQLWPAQGQHKALVLAPVAKVPTFTHGPSEPELEPASYEPAHYKPASYEPAHSRGPFTGADWLQAPANSWPAHFKPTDYKPAHSKPRGQHKASTSRPTTSQPTTRNETP